MLNKKYIITLFFIILLFTLSCSSSNSYTYFRDSSSNTVKEEQNISQKKIPNNIYIKILIDKGNSFSISIGNNTINLNEKDINKIYYNPKNEYIYNNKRIGNMITVKKVSNSLSLCKMLNIEDYVAGVLSAEMGTAFKKEALKAQAIAARTYIYEKIYKNPNFIVTNSTLHQVYSSKNISYFKKISKSTENIILSYKNQPIQVFYHSSSGGIITTPYNVWKGSKLSYYSIKQDPFSKGIKDWELNIGKYFLRKKLQNKYPSISSSCYVTRLDIYKRKTDMRVETIIIFFSNNEKLTLSGYEFRQIIGTTKLKSTMFSIDKKGENFIFSGHGYGHGIGMSQYGANEMAKQDKTYKEILKFYYKDINFQKIK